MRRSFLLLLVLLAACQQKPVAPTCDVMADHVLELFSPPDDFTRDVREVFAKRCKDDQWSSAMRSCVGKTSSVVEPQNCKQKLLPAQAKQLETDLKAAERRETGRRIPAECDHYEKVLASFVACDKLPKDVRDDVAARFAQAKAEWATMTNKSELGSVCGNGIQALKSAAVECPGVAKW